MPRVRSFAPSWLNQPAPGHKLFAPTNDEKVPNALAFAKNPAPGRRQTIAKRGTEVFVAVGKQIRWGDLVYLKESWENRQGAGTRMPGNGSPSPSNGYDEEAGGSESLALGWRTIKTPVADEIRQLVMSPQEDYLAVLTRHTVHICMIPDSSHLTSRDTEPFKAKFWTLGPTTHVTSRSAVASAVWHPLGVGGSALVTVTEDAVVRVWELSVANRWSFDTSTLSIDLKKLADGTELEEDFSATTAAVNQGFSPDSFDMEVAAACFPGRGSGGWSSMTLWVAMTGGDVYALCPLLPHRWAPPPTLIPSLSVSIVSKIAAIEDDAGVSSQAKLLAQQQLEWMADLDVQEPRIMEGALGEPPVEIYQRPSRPGIVPRLQGPFFIEFNPDDEQDDEIELRDILVVGEKMSTADLMMGEDEDLDLGDNEQGLSLNVVCLLSASGQVKFCLDLDGVEAQWLPSKTRSEKRRLVTAALPSLLAFQTMDTLKPAEVRPESWPMFSEDITSRYAFYVTHTAGITHVSLAPWVFRLEKELPGDSEAGAAFRLDLLVKGQGSDRERIYTQRPEQGLLAAVVAMRDPDLGYFCLSSTQQDPVALFFDTPDEELLALPAASESPEMYRTQQSLEAPLEMWEPRPLFHAAEILDTETGLYAWLNHLQTGKRRPLLQQEVRLSVATLEMFAEGHRLVSAHIFMLNQAVAELFRKCQSLQAELREQVVKANEAKHRIESITGQDVGAEGESDDVRMRRRIQAARKGQEELAARVEALKKRLGRTATRELSDKEKSWTEEVHSLEQTMVESPPSASKTYWQRASEAQSVWDALSVEVHEVQKRQRRASAAACDGTGPECSPPSRGFKLPAELRKAKLSQVKGMLERETALVEAVKRRLERLA